MFELNATIVLFILSFLLFIWMLDGLFLKPVGDAIEARRLRIESDNSAARELSDKSNEEVDKYAKKVALIREEAQKLINDAVTQAQGKRSEKLLVVVDSGRKKLEEARLELKGEHKSLVTSLVEEEIALVGNIVSRLVGNTAVVSLDASTVERRLEEAS
ncbi:MAG: hypothetical protein K8F91_03560 [Candidatus Obscuribacterales bacterium]|nr:hypothetical protein [Candidatus Obscuribacterales bacterium]